MMEQEQNFNLILTILDKITANWPFHLMKVSKLRTIDESSLQCWKMWLVLVETYTTWNGSAMSSILSLTNVIMYSLFIYVDNTLRGRGDRHNAHQTL